MIRIYSFLIVVIIVAATLFIQVDLVLYDVLHVYVNVWHLLEQHLLPCSKASKCLTPELVEQSYWVRLLRICASAGGRLFLALINAKNMLKALTKCSCLIFP